MVDVTIRPHRINLDGKSETETRIGAVQLLPGQFVVIDANDKYALANAATDLQKQLRIVGKGSASGLEILDPIPLGESVVADYVKQGRHFAARLPANAVLKFDTPLTLDAATGDLKIATITGDTPDTVVAYSQENYTVHAAGKQLVIVRIA